MPFVISESFSADFLEMSPDREYLFRVGALFSGPGTILEPAWLIVSGDRIQALGAGPPPECPAAIAVDRPDIFLAPALIDAHVHLSLNPGDNLNPRGRLAEAARHGLIGLRDGGDRSGLIQTLAEDPKGNCSGVLVSVSGPALFAPGRYGTFIGRSVADRAEMATALDELVRKRVARIKILASGPVGLDRFGQVGPAQFSAGDIEFLVNEARSRGLGVMAHANGPEAVEQCLAAGVTSLEHGYFMGPANLERLADSETFWIPTIIPLAGRIESETDPGRRVVLERTVAHQMDQLCQARDRGARLALGTDAGCPGVAVGTGLGREMIAWLTAGLALDEILTAATTNGAELLGLGNRLGRLAPGYFARMVGWSREQPWSQAWAARPTLIARPRTVTGRGN